MVCLQDARFAYRMLGPYLPGGEALLLNKKTPNILLAVL